MDILRETNLTFLGPKKIGKVRDIYEQEDKVILISTDRHSSFDRLIAHIPRKGEVLNRTSAFWFDKTRHIVKNHLIAIPDPNVTVARRCKPLPIEAVVRGYLTGVTATSIWTHYKAGKRDFGNFSLQDGMRKNERLAAPVFTPSTKEDLHDRTLSPQEIVAEGLMDKGLLGEVERISLELFAYGQSYAASRGLLLVDTKYEFGIGADGRLTLIDEVHTPDSSRYWFAGSYDERFAQGLEPEYFDKEFLRLWFLDHCDPYKDASLPEAPAEMVTELSRRYQEIFYKITDESIVPLAEDIAARIARNLEPYAAA